MDGSAPSRKCRRLHYRGAMNTTAGSDAPESRHLWIDATAGIAGDMLLGALVDVGADLAIVQAAVDAVIPHSVALEAATVHRAGLRALKINVQLLRDDQPHRTWLDLRNALENAALSDAVRQTVTDVFARLADAEGRVHGIPPDEVHFHEVGAWDSIADIVGCVAAIEQLGIQAVSSSPVALGSGRITASHGDLPVPAPATLQLSTGWKVLAGGQGELTTPTGMALLRTFSREACDLPSMSLEAIGVGAGDRDVPLRPNVVRVLVGHLAVTSPTGPLDGSLGEPTTHDTLFVLQANVDDLDPRLWPEVLAKLMDAGAADAWLSPITMKKGRPAHTLSVLCDSSTRHLLRKLMFVTTTTLGIREQAVTRASLDRDWRTVTVRGVDVRVKISIDAAGNLVHATPEFDDVVKAAAQCGVPVRQMLTEVSAVAVAAGLRTSIAGEPGHSGNAR